MHANLRTVLRSSSQHIHTSASPTAAVRPCALLLQGSLLATPNEPSFSIPSSHPFYCTLDVPGGHACCREPLILHNILHTHSSTGQGQVTNLVRVRCDVVRVEEIVVVCLSAYPKQLATATHPQQRRQPAQQTSRPVRGGSSRGPSRRPTRGPLPRGTAGGGRSAARCGGS